MMYYLPYELESIISESLSVLSSYSVLGFAIGVFTIVMNYLVLEKAGERGWKCMIPFYNEYLEFKLYWKPVMYWVYLLLPIVAIVLGIVGVTCLYYDVAITVAVAAIDVIIVVALAVISIKLKVKKGKCFGESGLFGLGLILFEKIFIAVLALDKKCQYVGNTKSTEKTASNDEASQEVKEETSQETQA